MERPGLQILTVWGDPFQPETRTIMCMIKMAGELNHEFHQLDQFQGDHKKEDYLKINPMGSIPTITEGRFQVLGGYPVFIKYLVNKHLNLREKLYPEDQRQAIDQLLLWFQSIMRVCTQRLIRMSIGP